MRRLSVATIGGRALPLSSAEDFDNLGGGGGGPSPTPPLYALRDTGPGGGHIFYLTDSTGEHGMEAALVGTEWSLKEWKKRGTDIPGCGGLDIGTGYQNCLDWIAAGGYSDSAINLAWYLSSGGKTDWYLPSREELHMMYAQLYLFGVGGFTGGIGTYYWSSSEQSSTNSYAVTFANGQKLSQSKSNDYYVRAIRNF